ncbi:MAG: hypothetical protein H7Z43_03265, partial [Clostridia bacterium]|nr:hypothetical protein [Deltaproteobacteria bacterium]
IMDYSARAFDDIAGIGPYDEAAIAFGYGGLVEVWNTGVAPYDQADLLYLYDYTDIPKILGGGLSCTNNANCQDDLEAAIDHYSAYLGAEDIATRQTEYELYSRGLLTYLKNALTGQTAKPDNIRARRYISFDTLYKATRDYYVDNDPTLFTYDEVPYKFCPDELVYDANVTCQPFDKGANYRELVNDRWERYSQYYAFSAFKRDRVSFGTRQTNLRRYASQLSRSFFGPISAVYRYYLYGNNGLGYDLSGQWVTLNDFPIGKDWQTASIDGLNDLVSVVEMPEPGDYCLDAASIYQPMTAGSACATAQMNVPPGVGRYFNTAWSEEYDFEPTRVGAFWDKYAAYTAITSNEGFFYRNYSDYLDSGAFSLSYWRGLNKELLGLFAQSFDPSKNNLAWRYDATASTDDGKFRAMPLIDGYSAPLPAGNKIAPSSSWTLRYYSVVLPMARYDSMFDYTEDFLNYSRVCLAGYSDCVTFGVDEVRYEDPLTRYVYIAPRTVGTNADLTLNEENLGALAVADAVTYAANYEAIKQAYVAAAGGSDPAFIASSLAALQQKEAGINERSSFLDILRQLSATFEK